MRIALPLVLLACLLAPAAASARDMDTWATVNVCDTAKQPDTIGIRASMSGLPKGVKLSMRFRVQYKAADGTWADVAEERLEIRHRRPPGAWSWRGAGACPRWRR